MRALPAPRSRSRTLRCARSRARPAPCAWTPSPAPVREARCDHCRFDTGLAGRDRHDSSASLRRAGSAERRRSVGRRGSARLRHGRRAQGRVPRRPAATPARRSPGGRWRCCSRSRACGRGSRFEAGMAQLGGHAIYLTHDVVLGARESVRDVARNLERFVDAIVVRTGSARGRDGARGPGRASR